MSWFASFGVALLTAVVALFGAGTVAGLSADWHSMSSFEGAAGFFVVGMALFGTIGGFLIGLVLSRAGFGHAPPRFGKALGRSCGAVVAILAAIAGVSWKLADIPPEIDGEELFLVAEIRWPASGAVAPDALADVPYLGLGALSGSVARKLERGPVFVEDARQEDGRWIVPGAVPIFTSRGSRLLDFGAGSRSIAGFIVPLPAHPGEAERRWSAWLPTPRPDGPAPPHGYTYRFKVIRESEPVRTETIGPFEVDTVASYFYNVTESDRLAATATFRVRYKGQAIPEVTKANTVAVVGGSKPALFVTIAEPVGGLPCALVIDEGSAVRVHRVSGCAAPATDRLLTSDGARFAAAKAYVHLPGTVDRVSFAEPGLFQVGAAVIDTRDLTTTEFTPPSDAYPDTDVPPLGLSPDEHSFVWLAHETSEGLRLGVTNWRTSQSYLLPIDRTRMRFTTEASIDLDWVRHHFAWQRGADGVDVLVERPDFVPLPESR